MALAQFLAKSLARRTLGGIARRRKTELGSRWWHQNVQNALFSSILGSDAYLGFLRLSGLLDSDVGQVADDCIHILAHITNFGELGGFDLDEGGIRQTRQTAGNFGFPHASGTNHQDIFRCNFTTQRSIHHLPTPAVAQGNGHRALGLRLPDDVFIQFGNDVLGSQCLHVVHRVSMVWCILV